MTKTAGLKPRLQGRRIHQRRTGMLASRIAR
jgi:hypothetical protein